jgi:hypothetical protein
MFKNYKVHRMMTSNPKENHATAIGAELEKKYPEYKLDKYSQPLSLGVTSEWLHYLKRG